MQHGSHTETTASQTSWRAVMSAAERGSGESFSPPLQTKPEERRRHERVAVALPVQLEHEQGSSVVETHDLSESGACIESDGSLDIGQIVEMTVDLPMQVEPARVQAEVRWARKGKVGIVFRSGAVGAIAAFVGTMLGAPTASAAAKTSIPHFDPNADTTVQMDVGGERPDEVRVLEAFEHQYGSFDECVAAAKKGRDRTLPGDVDVEVLLNPKGHTPLGVNATLPNSVDKKSLRECLRSAVAAADYPSYDGPPVVVAFNFELDPGTYYEEE